MRFITPILLTALSIVLPAELYSQEDAKKTLGIGISLNPARIGSLDYLLIGSEFFIVTNGPAVNVYVPINVSETYRLEPSIGLVSARRERNDGSSGPGNTHLSQNTAETSALAIGIGAFYLPSLSENLSLYVGPRLDLLFLSATYISREVYTGNFNSDIATTREETETDVTAGFVFGAEYFPVPMFSTGGECELNYTSYGNPTVTNSRIPPAPPNNSTSFSERKQHTWRTDVLFFVRWYFL